MTEVQTIKEILVWIRNRIKELPEGKSIYYKDLEESFKWELKTAKERELDNDLKK
jgi:hypothetical protein